MGLDSDGDTPSSQTEAGKDAAVVGMDLEETNTAVVGKSQDKHKRTSLQNEAAKTVGKTGKNMQMIDEGDDEGEDEEEAEEILGMKNRKWKKINLSFTIKAAGQEDADAARTDDWHLKEQREGNNKPMKHHPIMTPIAKFINAIEKNCKTVKVMSSLDKLVLDPKVCTDSWSVNDFKKSFAYTFTKNRQRNVHVTLNIDYGMTQNLWKLKHKVMETLKTEGLWIVSHNGPIEIVETTQIGFFAGLHPELYRRGYQDNINLRIADHFNKNKEQLILRAHESAELRDFLGPLPDVQIIPLTIPGTNNNGRRSPKVLATGVSVPRKFRSLFKYILHSVSNDMGIEYVDFTMKYDEQRKVLYNKLIRVHQEFMHNHKTTHIHCMEREEMATCVSAIHEVESVIAVDETVITERNGTWVIVMKYPYSQSDLEKIDKIIVNNPVKNDRTLKTNPFRKKQEIESLNTDALSAQENKYKNFTATPFQSTASWSSKLFPPRNITTQRGGRSTKTAISIDDDNTITTLSDTVTTLQRTVEDLTRELSRTNTTMATIVKRVDKEEDRGDIITVKIDALEKSQQILAESLTGQYKQLVNGIQEGKEEAKKEALELKEMMRQLLTNSNNNNVSSPQQQTHNTGNGQVIYAGSATHIHQTTNPVTGSEKRKQDAKTPSSTSEEKEISSPDRRKQRHSNSSETVPTSINFDLYAGTNDAEMTHTDVEYRHPGEHEEDEVSTVLSGANNTTNEHEEETGIQDMHTEDSDSAMEEEIQTITGDERTKGMDVFNEPERGFIEVNNGRYPASKTDSRSLQQEHFTKNPYSALQETTLPKDKSNSNTSAKTDQKNKNE